KNDRHGLSITRRAVGLGAVDAPKVSEGLGARAAAPAIYRLLPVAFAGAGVCWPLAAPLCCSTGTSIVLQILRLPRREKGSSSITWHTRFLTVCGFAGWAGSVAGAF